MSLAFQRTFQLLLAANSLLNDDPAPPATPLHLQPALPSSSTSYSPYPTDTDVSDSLGRRQTVLEMCETNPVPVTPIYDPRRFRLPWQTSCPSS